MNHIYFKRTLFILTFSFIVLYCYSQVYTKSSDIKEKHIGGRVLEMINNEPIFGAYISSKGRVLSSSIENGEFDLDITLLKPSDTIIITHLAYEGCKLTLDSLKDIGTVHLIEKSYLLNAVTVIPTRSLQIIKKAEKRFDQTYRQMPYWSRTNYRQIMTFKGKTRGYIELEGNAFLIGNKERNAFIVPFIIPDQVRRTTEDTMVSSLFHDPCGRLQFGVSFIEQMFLEYRFFEIFHPLSNRAFNNFEFHIDSVDNYQKKSVYIISFKQKKSISQHGWPLLKMKGQIWIDKMDFSLMKIACSFDRQNIASTEIWIEYGLYDNTIYPKNISCKLINSKFYKNDNQQKIYIESYIQFSNIDPAIRKDSKNLFNTYLIEYNLPSFRYNNNFWLKQPLDDNRFKNNILELLGKSNPDFEFERGAGSKIFKDGSECFSALLSFKKSSEMTIDYMNKNVKFSLTIDN
jgi:hypothetical protein